MMALLIAVLLVSISTVTAETTATKGSEENPAKEDFTECGVAQSDEDFDTLPSKQANSQGEINYVSGGVCIDDVQLMKGIANKFPLEVVLVEKTKDYEKENYLADVKVQIRDKENTQLLDIYTEGPFLLVNLPNGQYAITAEYNGITKERKVKINKKSHTRVVFRWLEPTESEETQ